MPSAGLRVGVPAIPGVELPYGLLNGCTTVLEVPEERAHELNGVEWLAVGCQPAGTTTWCPPDEEPVPPKTFNSPEIEFADPVTVFAGAECSAPGFSFEQAQDQARQALLLGRQAALERWFWENVIMPRVAAAATDLTPVSGAVPLVAGVGALEGCLAGRYGGVGVLHVPAQVATSLSDHAVVSRDGARLRTLLGNCAVLGAGYQVNTGPDGQEPAEDGEWWLAITGPIQIRRELVAGEVPAEDGESVNIVNNDRQVLAEQTFVPGTTCTPCAIRVTV